MRKLVLRRASGHALTRPPLVRVLFALMVVELWQSRLRGVVNRRLRIVCRFEPSCSEYTIQAILNYGVFSGIFRGYRRIRRCTPDNTDTCIDPP